MLASVAGWWAGWLAGCLVSLAPRPLYHRPMHVDATASGAIPCAALNAQEGLVVVDLERDEVALGGDPLLPRCMSHPYVARLTARLR